MITKVNNIASVESYYDEANFAIVDKYDNEFIVGAIIISLH
jgi:hypothetical protein